MKQSAASRFPPPRSVLLWGLCLGLALGASLALAATPRAKFGSATISSADNRISVTRLPVIDGDGKVSYKDVIIDFTVDSAGTLELDPGTPTIDTSPALKTGGFKAGVYTDTRGNTYRLTGPGVVPGTNRSLWSLVLTSSKDAKIFSLSLVTGPVAGHPYEARLKERGITSTFYSWGNLEENQWISSTFPFYTWYETDIVGAIQVGSQLILKYFACCDDIDDAGVTLTKTGR